MSQISAAYPAYSLWARDGGHKARLHQRLQRHGFTERQVAPDGNCQFRAISDQLFDTEAHHRVVRSRAVEWLRDHEARPIDKSGTRWSDFLDLDEFKSAGHYCHLMERDGTWGDHFSLMGAAEALDCDIKVISSVAVEDEKSEQYITTITPQTRPKSATRRTLHLAHHAENHYNSLRPAKAP
jgi:hypothetical protein